MLKKKCVCVHARVHARMCACVHVCVCVCACVRACMRVCESRSATASLCLNEELGGELSFSPHHLARGLMIWGWSMINVGLTHWDSRNSPTSWRKRKENDTDDRLVCARTAGLLGFTWVGCSTLKICSFKFCRLPIAQNKHLIMLTRLHSSNNYLHKILGWKMLEISLRIGMKCIKSRTIKQF